MVDRVPANVGPPGISSFDSLSGGDGGDDIDWLIDGLLERQGRVLIAGDEGCGKSLLSMTLAAQAAAGLPVLGRWSVPVGLRVVYFELEMGLRTSQRRARLLNLAIQQAGGEVPPDEFLFVHRPLGFDIGSRSKEASNILAWLASVEPDLVIFDPLYRMTSTDAVGEAELRPLVNFVAQVRERGAALWIVHHTRKRQGGMERGKDSSDVYGSSILLRWPETVLALHDDGNKRGRLRVLKDREGFFEDSREFLVERGGRWPIGVVEQAPMDVARVKILDALSIDGARSANALSKDLHLRREDVSAAIRQLEADGIVERKGTGTRTAWGLTEMSNIIQMFHDNDPEG
jgi:hypothetical protein